MKHFQKITTLAVVLAFAVALSASAAGKKKEAAPLTPKDAVAKIDGAIKAFQSKSVPKANKLLEEANKILSTLPESEETSEAKGYYYQTKAEIELLVNNNLEKFEANKKLCEENSKNYGAEINYFAGGFYFDVVRQLIRNSLMTDDIKQKMEIQLKQTEYTKKSVSSYLKAFEFDPEMNKLSGDDLEKFQTGCSFSKNYSAMAIFYDKYINSKTRFYLNKLGANATAIYEKTKSDNPDNIVKAVLVTILDFEAQKNPDGNALIAILEKNFSKYKECTSAIAFIKKFYSDSQLSQADLNSLPEGVRDFMPVRYMYKMKTSNDVAALNEEFGTFFGHVANYKARIAAKK